jgi:predicted dehydrogenase
MFSEFTDAVINKKPMPIPVSDAIANMKLLDALARSAKSNGWEDVK